MIDKVRLNSNSKYKSGYFQPKNPDKYVGDPSNIIYRSGWELRVCKWFDETQAIIHWNSEGLILPYFFTLDGKTHKYHIDFVAKIQNRKGEVTVYAIEVKPHKETMMPSTKNQKRFALESITYTKNQCKWSAAKIWCEAHNMKFIVLDEYDIGIKQRPKK